MTQSFSLFIGDRLDFCRSLRSGFPTREETCFPEQWVEIEPTLESAPDLTSLSMAFFFQEDRILNGAKQAATKKLKMLPSVLKHLHK